jgi:hypothetical protein
MAKARDKVRVCAHAKDRRRPPSGIARTTSPAEPRNAIELHRILDFACLS